VRRRGRPQGPYIKWRPREVLAGLSLHDPVAFPCGDVPRIARQPHRCGWRKFPALGRSRAGGIFRIYQSHTNGPCGRFSCIDAPRGLLPCSTRWVDRSANSVSILGATFNWPSRVKRQPWNRPRMKSDSCSSPRQWRRAPCDRRQGQQSADARLQASHSLISTWIVFDPVITSPPPSISSSASFRVTLASVRHTRSARETESLTATEAEQEDPRLVEERPAATPAQGLVLALRLFTLEDHLHQPISAPRPRAWRFGEVRRTGVGDREVERSR